MKLVFLNSNLIYTLLFIIVGKSFSFSQSDNCVLNSSTLLTPTPFGSACSPVAGNTSSGFTDSNQGCPDGNEDDDVWYRFVATATTHTVTVDGATDMDPVLGVYSDCSGTQPAGGACSDGPNASDLEICNLSGLTIGNTYYICVHDYDTGGGNFTICVTSGATNVNMSTGTSTGCAFLFRDNGGNGDYSNSQNLTRTFCPSSAGQCMKAVFTSFDLEDNFDYLSVYDGNSTSAPMILGSSFTSSSPGTITATSTNTSGCLTFNFYSDGATVSSGWSANITCGSCVAAPSVAVQQDCYGAVTICGNQSIPGNSLGSGNYNDANQGLGNLGCLNNYGSTDDGSAEHQSSWYFFSPSASGTIGMTIAPNTATSDYDWAIWGPYSTISCPPTGLPLRCSAAAPGNSAGGQTGLGNGATDTEEGSSGNGWVAPITVTAGQKYILFLDNWNTTSTPFNISWQLSGGASLACATLPIELTSFTGNSNKGFNSITWITASENNNDYFLLERSIDGVNWREITKINGAGNSLSNKHYLYDDYSFINNTINYYRLKQIDFSGEFEYSNIISIESSETIESYLSDIHPNPTNENIYFNLFTSQSGIANIELIDFMGNSITKEEQQINSGKNDLKTNMSYLKNGIYILKITTLNDGKCIYQRVIKN